MRFGLIIDVVAASQSLGRRIFLPIVWHSGLHHPIPEHQGLDQQSLHFHFSAAGRGHGSRLSLFAQIMLWHLDDPCKPFSHDDRELCNFRGIKKQLREPLAIYEIDSQQERRFPF